MPTPSADSAGHPWAGRHFEPNAYADDDGSTPPLFDGARSLWRESPVGTTAGDEAFEALVALMGTTRFLIPLVAHAGDMEAANSGLVVDKTQELSVVNVAGPRGERVLPVFSSAASMSAWRSDARPVPVAGQRCALAAVQDECSWMVIDPGMSPSVVVRRPAVRAIAQGVPWTLPHRDPELAAALTAGEPAVDQVWGITLENGDPLARGEENDLIVRVTLAPGLDHDQVSSLMSTLTTVWSGQPLITERAESMRVVVVPGSPRSR